MDRDDCPNCRGSLHLVETQKDPEVQKGSWHKTKETRTYECYNCTILYTEQTAVKWRKRVYR